tara:strand:- start:862 stop:1452 length:591 start_codon:yes stop_codon:yes gene_type:complete
MKKFYGSDFLPRKKMKLFFVILFLVPTLSYSSFNFGTYVPYFLKAQTSKEADTTKIAFNPFASYDYNLFTIWSQKFNPEAGFVYHFDAKDNSTHQTIFLLYNFEYDWSSSFALRYGLGTFLNRISGDGSTVTLNNGESTSDFYAPSELQTSYTSSLNFGFKLNVSPKWLLRFDTQVMRFASSTKRSFSYLLSVGLK